MKRELQEVIMKDFPFMMRGQSLDEQKAAGGIYDLYGAFGMEIGDGWFNLLYDLCKEIEDIYIKEGKSVDIIIDQIKEKFGALRFYYHHSDDKNTIHAIDFLGTGTMRLYPDDKDILIKKKIKELVSEYEKKSKSICEVCGSEGVLRTERPWIRTLCDACSKSDETC